MKTRDGQKDRIPAANPIWGDLMNKMALVENRPQLVPGQARETETRLGKNRSSNSKGCSPQRGHHIRYQVLPKSVVYCTPTPPPRPQILLA